MHLSRLTTDDVWRALRRSHAWLTSAPGNVLFLGGGCAALAASSDIANSTNAPREGGPLPALLLAATLALAFACFLLAARLQPDVAAKPPRGRARVTRYLLYPLLLWALFTGIQTATVIVSALPKTLAAAPARYGSDDLYYNHYNALLVLRGENPYAGPWLAAEARYFGDLAYTPLRRGVFSDPRHYPTNAQMDAVMRAYLRDPAHPPVEIDPATTHSYPAGAFLVNVPGVWAGVASVGFTQILVFLALLALIIRVAPAEWRLALALLALTVTDGAREVTGSDFEIWPLFFLALAWAGGGYRWRSALALGAACAIKQTAWLAAPFYLLWIWRRDGAREAARRLGIAAGFFVLINLPWIVASPRSWLTSLFLPVSLPLLPDGSGLIGISLTGILPLLPPVVYSALELAALLGALLWYWRNWARVPYAGLVLPLLPLLFAWRSSERYFVLLPLAGVLAVALTLRAQRKNAQPRTPQPYGLPEGV